MFAHAYIPDESGWSFLCRSDLVLGIERAVDDDRLASLWRLIEGGARSTVVLDEITRGGISTTPSFVLLDRATKSSLRVLARGPIRVRVSGADGETTISGAKVTSWSEHTVGLPADVTCEVDAASSTGAPLPVGLGVVRARSLHAGFGTTTPAFPVAMVDLAEAPRHALITEAVAPEEKTIDSSTAIITDTVAPTDSGYDHLFGETMIRSVEDAAVRGTDTGDDAAIEDRTVVAGDLAAIRANRRAARRAESATEAPASPRLWVDLSTGGRESLDQTLIVGRAPSASRVTGDNLPRLVTMTTPNQDISRTHAQFAVEGGTVVVTDLHSRNGTLVALPGKPPQKLRAGEPTAVIVGTVVDLGDGATLTVGEDS